jgi:hypothetical protein
MTMSINWADVNWGDVATWIATVVAFLALALSILQWRRNEWSPYRLVVMPPAITQTNDALPSLILDVAAVNRGGHDAVVSDIVVRLRSGGKDTGGTLHAQQTLSRESRIGGLPLDPERTTSCVFLPVLFRRNEPQALKLYCAPFSNDLQRAYDALLSIDEIQIDFWVNGEEKSAAFRLPYLDYRDKFKGGDRVEIPKSGGFQPRWFRTVTEVHLRR